MGQPLLLLEAASAYQGDLEDRLTEVLATALSEHAGFCRTFVSHIGVAAEFVRCTVRTQESFSVGPARLDLVIRAFGASDEEVAVLFVENKYNPHKLPDPYWFTEDQACRQRAALASQTAGERHLVAIASDRDLRRPIPPEYARTLGWRAVAELANISGGEGGWQALARQPSAPASQRILLEFWAYLKGDTVGAIDNDDLETLGRIVRAEDRVSALLEHVAEALSWDETDVAEDWVTGGESPIQYISRGAGEDSWLGERMGGSQYVLIANAEWHDTSPAGQPHLYAGGGFFAKREERSTLAQTDWAKEVQSAGMNVFMDADGVYMLAGQPLAEVLATADTLSGQARRVASWAQDALSMLESLPKPADLSERKKPSATRQSRRRPLV